MYNVMVNIENLRASALGIGVPATTINAAVRRTLAAGEESIDIFGS